MENGQGIIWECPDVVLFDQITFTEFGRSDPHTVHFGCSDDNKSSKQQRSGRLYKNFEILL
jgi:hypothetical protein